MSAVGCRYTRTFTIYNNVLLTNFRKDMFGMLGLNMRNHSNNEGTVAKRKFMSVCPFGLIEFYCEDIIDCKLCDMLKFKLVFIKYGI